VDVRIRMKVVVVVVVAIAVAVGAGDGERSHWMAVLELVNPVQISRGRIEGQHRGWEVQVLQREIEKRVLGLRESSQVLVLTVRRDSLEGELVVEEMVVLVVRAQVAFGIVVDLQEDMIEVLRELAVESMEVDVTEVQRRRLERRKD
jgi:hypothetical protein